MAELMEPPPWADAAWTASVTAWVEARLAEIGLAITGPMERRARPWSIVIAVPTRAGRCWFKTTASGMANDALLTSRLHELAPDLVLRPLASDPARGWMLLPDGGPRLRDVADAATLLGHWEAILPAYAELQRRTEGLVTELAAGDLPDRRPERLPQLLVDLLQDRWWLRIDEPDGLTGDGVSRLRAMIPRLAGAAEELAAAGVRPAIQHDDLHDGNVLVGADGHRIVDWGDACVGHPFTTMLVTLRFVADTLRLPDWAPFGAAVPELDRLRDAYLEPWTSVATRDQLVRLLRLATWTGMIGRALTWRAAARHASAEELADWGSSIPGWLAELADAAPPAEAPPSA
jgi:Phosphotransferase enzyme family